MDSCGTPQLVEKNKTGNVCKSAKEKNVKADTLCRYYICTGVCEVTL